MSLGNSFLSLNMKPNSQVYRPLERPDQQIRLLQLLPGNSSILQASLKVIDFNDAPKLAYEALSYTWGTEENSESILISEASHELEIRPNLKEALISLRLDDKMRVLWIDAICINQNDVEERNQQILLMHNIYKYATRVAAWIGPTSFDSDCALDCVETINANVAFDWSLGALRSLSEDHRWTNDAEFLPFSDNQILAIGRFLDRPWFQRLWIWNEIRIGAGRATLLCGERELAWSKFRDAVLYIYNKPARDSTAAKHLLSRIIPIHGLCQERRMGFLSALDSCRWCECSDPRDRVFTALMLDEYLASSLEIQPDYQKSTQEVYIDAIVKYLARNSDLAFLQYLESPKNIPDLPTWVPDWSSKTSVFTFQIPRASASSRSAAFVDSNRILRAKGLAITAIAKVVPFAAQKSLLAPGYQVDENLAEVLRRVIDEEDSRKFSERLDAVCRVLVQDDISERNVNLEDSLPSQKMSRAYLDQILGLVEAMLPLSESRLIRRIVQRTCLDRNIFISTHGNHGAGPLAALPGDILAVLLGCPSAVVLRQHDTTTYKVIGEAYYDGIMGGEALLGPLPAGYTSVRQHDKDSQVYHWAYRKHDTGELLMEDPRLPDLPPEWESVPHDADHLFKLLRHGETGVVRSSWDDPRCDLEALERRGLQFIEFPLV